MESKRQPQEFDNTLKALFDDEAPRIVATLVPEAEIIGDQNIEVDRTLLRADLAFYGRYKGQEHTINLELQTGADGRMPIRLLQYHVGLLSKYGLPVLSVVMYAFETTLPTPPYQEVGGGDVHLHFNYKVVALWKIDATEVIRKEYVFLYTLLPAMKGATASLLLEAVRMMKAYYPQKQFGHHLIRFHRILQRSNTISEQDKRIVEEELYMQYKYDWFIDDNPVVQERIAKHEAKAEMEAKRDAVLKVVGFRFPSLLDSIQPRIEAIHDIDDLDWLFMQVLTTLDAPTVLNLLNTLEVCDGRLRRDNVTE